MRNPGIGSTVRILLADDHDVVRRGLRQILEREVGWTVQAEARNGREALEMAIELRPTVAVLDLSMPELNGLEAARRIRAACADTEILILTMHDGEEVVREVAAAGARGFLIKFDADEQIIPAVRALVRREAFLRHAEIEPV
jgi:DNA-binding NarL/FixJ family response regulator